MTTLLMTCPVYFDDHPKDAYRWYLMKAILETAGANIVVPQRKLQRPYVRNEYFQVGSTLFFGKTESDAPSEEYARDVMELCKIFTPRNDMRVCAMDVEDMNGGNLLFLPEKNAILFGCLSPDEIKEHQNQIRQIALKIGRKIEAVPIKARINTHASVKYDLDLFVSRLPHGELVVYKDAIEKESFDRLCQVVDKENVIVSSYAQNCNLMAIGDNIVLPLVDTQLKQKLKERGYHVIDKAEILLDKDFQTSVAKKLTRAGYHVGKNVFNNIHTDGREIALNFDENASFHCITNSLSPQRELGLKR